MKVSIPNTHGIYAIANTNTQKTGANIMSMAGYPDEFDWTELDSGLPNNFTGRIQNPVFKYDTDYQNGEVIQLVMDVMPLPDQEVNTMQTVKYACKGWTTRDNGRTIVREDGKAKNFHESSAMGLAIKSLIESGDLRSIPRYYLLSVVRFVLRHCSTPEPIGTDILNQHH